MNDLLWTPPPDAFTQSAVAQFAARLEAKGIFAWHDDFHRLWQWSVDEIETFWSEFWDEQNIIGEKGARICANPDTMTGGQFFPDGYLNYAENLLTDADDQLAIIAHSEDGARRQITRAELRRDVIALAGWLKAQGVTQGDRVAAYTPNIPEAVMLLLASSAIGAVFSSCSTDFGLNGVFDRFGQIAPKVLMVVDGYRYNGKIISRAEINHELIEKIPSISSVLIVPFIGPFIEDVPTKHEKAIVLDEAIAEANPISHFTKTRFNDPLYILYSSGTTGAPKCLVHGGGGSLIQHLKEHKLHADIRPGDRVFYFTTCGWMMWNWLVSALASKAAIVLYEGSPFYPDPSRLWRIADSEGITLFGVSAKYIDASRKSGVTPAEDHNLSALRLICSTGSPLTKDGFAFVYQSVKPDVQLASITGGTDLVSCFALGAPVLPVYSGEIQTRGLGMAVQIFDQNGEAITESQGEMVCVKPFPSMPIFFWDDPDGAKYRNGYFTHFDGIWRHGDWATVTPRGGIIVHGRSDATLNPGGVRIGTAEIYRQVEAFDAVIEALVVGQTITQDGQQDVRVVLFVRLAEGAVLDEGLKGAITAAIRKGTTPRHMPYAIIAVADIPRTRSGKITELAVRDIIHGREISNTEALANPESLRYFQNLSELR